MPLSAVALQLWGGHRDQCMRCGHQDLVQLVQKQCTAPVAPAAFSTMDCAGYAEFEGLRFHAAGR
jgi:hypothetical protein